MGGGVAVVGVLCGLGASGRLLLAMSVCTCATPAGTPTAITTARTSQWSFEKAVCCMRLVRINDQLAGTLKKRSAKRFFALL